MTYYLIKGSFHVVGYSPDGDSIKFKANNPKRWDKIQTEFRDKFQANLEGDNGAVQLRLQGVDALETHYSPTRLPTPSDLRSKETFRHKKPDGGDHKQPIELADQATTFLLNYLGVKDVAWQSWGKNTWIKRACIEYRKRDIWVDKRQEDQIPGYIITQDVEKNGRPIAWVFAGKTRTRDGSRITKSRLADRVERSGNYHLLRQGLVYPYFFMTLPGRLRDKLAEAARLAQEEAAEQLKTLSRSRKKSADKLPNLWLYDKTMKGITLSHVDYLTEKYEIYPYLFRKILKHWYRQNMEVYWDALRTGTEYEPPEDEKKLSLSGFFETGNPYIFVISDQDFVRLDEVVEIKRNRLKIKKYPFDIVFLS